MVKIFKILAAALLAFFLLATGGISVSFYFHNKGVAQANEEYREYQPPQIRNFGSTNRLSILPLVNWHTSNPDLKTEMGVSYLVKTDSATILFDLGQNADGESPSPLEYNMGRLEISLDEIDIIFISHNHFDHVGGQKWVDEGSFSLGNEQKDLSGKNVFTPVPMTYPAISPTHTPDPTVITEGVASIGTIPRKLYFGRIDEQALAVNLEGKGLVVIVGCGHQKLSRILERTEAVFEEPIYGIIGDLHYPVPEGRINVLGLNMQRLVASGEGPLNPIEYEDVLNNIERLQSRDIGITGVGGHDSSDEVIEEFKDAFGPKYRYVEVGKWIKAGN
ncbi:MBL fold metallo-hydrolase [Halalkalibaculum sp. DA3122]|uniref:MBL fold metallo-hydrolase n=1 Tax=unclassified Halalkalibaculum TaxID=2964617 RepID=UPI0037540CB8